MTTNEQTPEQTPDATGEAPAPVRVPNVSPGARSGLDHQVIGANAQAAYEANRDLAGDPAGDKPPVGETDPDEAGEVIPEDAETSADRLDWIAEAEDADTEQARAQAVLDAEQEKPEDEQDGDLIETLRSVLTPQE